MADDAGSIYRVKSAIDNTLERVAVEPGSANALRNAYATLRDETARLVDGELADEFGRLFPSAVEGGLGPDLLSLSAYANDYYSLLAMLSGWLDGIVQDRQSLREAAEYARARTQQESRG